MNPNATVNLAIQFLPLPLNNADRYSIIDKAIGVVQQSGLKYFISPFETTIEGTYAEVMEVLHKMQEAVQKAGAEELLINMKLHRNFNRSLHITDKTGKYTPQNDSKA